MKRFRFLLITLVLMILILPMSGIPVSAEESPVWDGKSAEEFAGGTGTAEDPYIIQTPQQLAFLSRTVSIGTSSFENEHVKLANNIVLNNTTGWENWNKAAPVNKWTPIGNDMFAFRGTFDGNGFTVSGIYCALSDYRGLFGYVFAGGTVKNVGVVNSYIQGGGDVGGVVGYGLSCTVSNCYYIGSISGNRAVGGVVGYLNGGVVTDCYNSGPVIGIAGEGINDGIGGVIGYAISDPAKPAVIKNCYNTGAVTGAGIQNGGVAGSAVSCKISNCCNTGMVSGQRINGGVTGYANRCTISNCYNVNAVEGPGDCAGGVAGWAISCTITNCYNTGTVKGEERVGGITGDISSYASVKSAIDNCYNTAKVQGIDKTGGIAGWTRGINCWFTSGAVNNSYYLKEAAAGGINGTDVSGHAVALTDAQMKQRDEFTDWDLVNVWEFGGSDLGYEYPTLIGVAHRETGEIVTVSSSPVKTNTGLTIAIIILCVAVAAGIIIYIFYTKKHLAKE